MPVVKYLDSSMWGSCYVDCEILEKIDEDNFKIKFWDDESEEFEIKVTNRDRLEFPKFNDYMFC